MAPCVTKALRWRSAPDGVPVDPEVPGERRDGGVVVTQPVDRPRDCSGGQLRSWLGEAVGLRPGVHLARRLRSARPACAIGPTPADRSPGGRDDRTHRRECRATGGHGGRDRSQPPRTNRSRRASGRSPHRRREPVLAAPHPHHMKPVDTEDLIGPSAPGRTGPTRTLSHVRVFRRVAWSLPIEGPDVLLRPNATPIRLRPT
jgi:hypothetical protein